MSMRALPPRIPVQSPDGIRINNPMTNNAVVPAALWRRAAEGSGWDMRSSPQFHIKSFAIEQVVGVERYDLAFRRDEMNTRTLHRRHAEVVLVQELNDRDAKNLVVTEIVRHLDLRQTAQ